MNHALKLSFGALLLIVTTVSQVVAAQETCPALVQAALATVRSTCASIGRNQACYGNAPITAQPQDNLSDFKFDASGDIVDVASLKSLTLNAMSLNDQSWGVALMNVQANLPDSLVDQNITVALFGDVAIANPFPPLRPLDMTTTTGANVRSRPSESGDILASLKRDTPVVAIGRSADASWIRIRLPEDPHGSGWIAASLLGSEGSARSLVVADANSPIFAPMQAFNFTSGVNDAPCAAAPTSGIMMQTPHLGGRRIDFSINGVAVTLSSATVYLQAQSNDFLTLTVVEGRATLSAFNVTQTIPAGTMARVPLDAQGQASGAPEVPQPYSADSLASLPLAMLPADITIAVPLSSDQIQNAISAAQGIPFSGRWDTAVTGTTGCDAALPGFGPSTLSISTANDGDILYLSSSGIKIQFNRTAPNVYARADVPIDYTQIGRENIMDQFILTIVSPSQLNGEEDDSIPGQNCSRVIYFTSTYLGP